MDIKSHEQINERTKPVRDRFRPIFEFILDHTTSKPYSQLLATYPENFVTHDHKQTLYSGVDPRLIDEKLVVDYYRDVVEELYIRGMFLCTLGVSLLFCGTPPY